MKLLLRELAIVTGLIALAGPRFGTQLEQVIPRGSDLYVLIDVSRSMLADDASPSRPGPRQGRCLWALVNRLEGERIGLIAFAGQAVVNRPLNSRLRSLPAALSTNWIPTVRHAEERRLVMRFGRPSKFSMRTRNAIRRCC